MDDAKKKRMIEVLGLIAEDAERDATRLDGQPFNGRTMATHFGYVFASIKTLSEIVKEVLEDEKK